MKKRPHNVPLRLTELAVDEVGYVAAVDAPRHSGGMALGERLSELGFFVGERLRVVARGPFGGEPIAVRVGTSTFALRRHEADCIRIDATHPEADPAP
ncbi:MAG TPA: FeoA family protein [Steroidobacteraceae bacterium]|jgi:ferrous iron transport protein A|nr:FeoA family protein [Steroidobacteraceae bacterium]